MADSFFFRSTLGRRSLAWSGRLATVAMLALLAWLGARAYWSFAAPRTPVPAMVVDTDALRVAQSLAARHLFGAEASVTASAPAPKVATNIKLEGVFAPSKPGRLGIAILSSQGKPAAAVREGEEIVPGVSLYRVLPRSVEIDEGGRIVSLEFPNPPHPANPTRPNRINPRRR